MLEGGAKCAKGINLKEVHFDARNTKPSTIVSWLHVRFFVKEETLNTLPLSNRGGGVKVQ